MKDNHQNVESHKLWCDVFSKTVFQRLMGFLVGQSYIFNLHVFHVLVGWWGACSICLCWEDRWLCVVSLADRWCRVTSSSRSTVIQWTLVRRHVLSNRGGCCYLSDASMLTNFHTYTDGQILQQCKIWSKPVKPSYYGAEDQLNPSLTCLDVHWQQSTTYIMVNGTRFDLTTQLLKSEKRQ